jgi:hypothetical protein
VAVVAYPVKWIDALSKLPRSRLTAVSVNALQLGAVAAIALWSLVLLAFGAAFHWGAGLIWLGLALAMAAIRAAIINLFGLGD